MQISRNVQAFLDTIAHSEIGPKLLSLSDNGYDVVVGSTPENPVLFKSYATHPKIRSQRFNSDAAGRYQFMGRYWDFYRNVLNIPDFGHESQDKWCIQLIKECHALDDVEAGRFDLAVKKCASRWASFPGAGYNQHENKMEDLRNAFTTAGGVLA